jgi:predicted AlkP superfamily phosphohydrolase/phosphomutase
MVEDHTGLVNGRIDEAAFLSQCELVMREREAMLEHELSRFSEGFLFCLFDTPDRVQHLFWRFREPDHPANRPGEAVRYQGVIAEHYRRCDQVVERVLGHADSETLVIVLSDHGFTSFRRGVHLNAWLRAEGLLTLKDGIEPGEDQDEFFHGVDWSRTKAYALGLGGIYLNRRQREGMGILSTEEADRTAAGIQAALPDLGDPVTGARPVRGVKRKEELYTGAYAAEAPDLLALFERGYRASWTTGLGGIGRGILEDNTRRWGGDHIVDPALVPGVLFMNRPFSTATPRLIDLAPTILGALGVPRGSAMEGADLLS